MMKELEKQMQKSGIIAGGSGELKLSFRGLKTGDHINPSQATALFLEIDQHDPFNQQGISKLKNLIHSIVQESVQLDLVSKSDLARSHIQFDRQTKTYFNRKLNLHLIQTRK